MYNSTHRHHYSSRHFVLPVVIYSTLFNLPKVGQNSQSYLKFKKILLFLDIVKNKVLEVADDVERILNVGAGLGSLSKI